MKNTYWNDLGKDGKTYQMGEQFQRMKVFDLLEEHDCLSLLDVGCGTGPMYQIIKERQLPIKYKGVDYSDTFIDTCKNEFPEGNWEVQDARKLKEVDNSFDCVLLLHALDHVDDYVSAINESRRVASKIVILVLWRPFVELGSGNNLNSVNENFEDTHLTDYDKSELDIAIEESGFKIVDEFQLNEGNKFNHFFVLGV